MEGGGGCWAQRHIATELCLCLWARRGGVYGLDLAPGRQYMEKKNNITGTPFEHYYLGCIKKTHIAGTNDVRFISNHNELHA